MADFLSQDEIDALLDVCDDNPKIGQYNELEMLNYTNDSLLVPIKKGAVGYILLQSSNNKNEPIWVSVIEIYDEYIIVIDNLYNPLKLLRTELELNFYKNTNIFEAVKTRKIYIDIENKIRSNYNLDMNTFFKMITKSQEYPELWI